MSRRLTIIIIIGTKAFLFVARCRRLKIVRWIIDIDWLVVFLAAYAYRVTQKLEELISFKRKIRKLFLYIVYMVFSTKISKEKPDQKFSTETENTIAIKFRYCTLPRNPTISFSVLILLRHKKKSARAFSQRARRSKGFFWGGVRRQSEQELSPWFSHPLGAFTAFAARPRVL